MPNWLMFLFKYIKILDKWLMIALACVLIYLAIILVMVQLNPGYSTAIDDLYEQAREAEAENRSDEALSLYNRILNLNPENRRALQSRAPLLIKQGKFAEAEADYRLLILQNELAGTVDPDQQEQLAWTLLLQNRLSEAYELAQKARVRDTYNPFYATLIEAHAMIMDGDEVNAAGLYLTSWLETQSEIDRTTMLETTNTLIGKGMNDDAFRRVKGWLGDFAGNEAQLLEAGNNWFSGDQKIAKFHQYAEAVALLDRAEAGFIAALGRDHPACKGVMANIDKERQEARQKLEPGAKFPGA